MEAVAPLPELTSPQPPIPSAAAVPTRTDKSASAKGKRNGQSPFVHYFLLLSIIVLGGALRFMYLDRPPIWGDEAATFGRASGTFAELMARLQSAGFAPVHYELVWWIGQHTLLTPFMMRLVPAITGTLMIPAMYWLAAQLIGHRAALLTALLTATNAFLLNYSRDAKMYSPFWFFAAVNVASLIWWLRVRTPLSWCAWITSGTAMVGFDALGWITVAIELLMVLTARRGNWLSLIRLLPLLIFASAVWCLTIGVPVSVLLIKGHAIGDSFRKIAIAVIVLAILRIVWLTIGAWLVRRNQTILTTTDAEEAPHVHAGLQAQPDEQSPLLVRIFRWPTERSLARPWIARRITRFHWPPIVLFFFGVGILLAGPFGYYYDFNRFLQKVDQRGWGGTGIDWVEGYDAGRDGPSLLGFTASAFVDSWEWPRAVDEPRIMPRTFRLLATGTLCIAGVIALGLLPFPWSRRISPLGGLGGWRSVMWLAIWLTLPPYAFYCVSIKDHAGPFPWIALPPHPGLFGANSTAQHVIVFVQNLFATVHYAASTGLRFAGAFIHLSRWISVPLTLLALAWLWVAGANWRERFLRAFQMLLIGIVTLLLIEAVYLTYPAIDAALSAHSEAWREHGSVWMPRYVAVILPSFLIIISALLFRLPTRPLRWACVLLVVIVNLSVHGARVFAGTEQPTGLMAQDIMATQRADTGDGSFRAYFQPTMQSFGAEPGSISIYSAAMRYYITILSPRPKQVDGVPMPINEVYADQMHYRVHPGRFVWMSYSGYIINEVRRMPNLRTFVTWERLEPHEIDLTDKPLDALEPDWRLAGEQTFAVRDHWRWKDTCLLRRRVYVRTASS